MSLPAVRGSPTGTHTDSDRWKTCASPAVRRPPRPTSAINSAAAAAINGYVFVLPHARSPASTFTREINARAPVSTPNQTPENWSRGLRRFPFCRPCSHYPTTDVTAALILSNASLDGSQRSIRLAVTGRISRSFCACFSSNEVSETYAFQDHCVSTVSEKFKTIPNIE